MDRHELELEAEAWRALEVIDRIPATTAGGRDSQHPALCRAFRDLAAAMDALYGPLPRLTTHGPTHRDITRGGGFLGAEVVPRPLPDFLSPDRDATRRLNVVTLES